MDDPGRSPPIKPPYGDALPPRQRTPFIRLAYPKDQAPVLVVAVGCAVYGKLCHWTDGRPTPCTCPDPRCAGFGAGWVPRWYGYLDALDFSSQARRIAVITEGAYRNSKALQRHDGELRGKLLRLERMGKGPNAPVRCQVTSEAIPFDLPGPLDVAVILERLWALDPGSLGRHLAQPESLGAIGEISSILRAKGGSNGNGK